MSKRKADWSIKRGAKLAELRINKGFSREYVASKIGTSRISIRNWEIGSNAPSSQYLHDMAFLYNVSVEEIMDEDYVKDADIQQDIDIALDAQERGQRYDLSDKVVNLINLLKTVTGGTAEQILEHSVKAYALRLDWPNAITDRFLKE